MAQNGST
jgi:hypothetical protein